MRWQPAAGAQGVPAKQVQPRVSMISGLTSTGDVYLALVQANSNTSMMELYFTNLVKLLDKKQPGWRSSTIILTDNAPYHSSKAVADFRRYSWCQKGENNSGRVKQMQPRISVIAGLDTNGACTCRWSRRIPTPP